MDSKENSQDSDLAQYLFSSEKFSGRRSPDLWPEQFPGINEFADHSNLSGAAKLQEWVSGFDKSDVEKGDDLSRLGVDELLRHVRHLQSRAFELGESEVRELNRGKVLNVLSKSKEATAETPGSRT